MYEANKAPDQSIRIYRTDTGEHVSTVHSREYVSHGIWTRRGPFWECRTDAGHIVGSIAVEHYPAALQALDTLGPVQTTRSGLALRYSEAIERHARIRGYQGVPVDPAALRRIRRNYRDALASLVRSEA